jgi:hypothetical protein
MRRGQLAVDFFTASGAFLHESCDYRLVQKKRHWIL